MIKDLLWFVYFLLNKLVECVFNLFLKPPACLYWIIFLCIIAILNGMSNKVVISLLVLALVIIILNQSSKGDWIAFRRSHLYKRLGVRRYSPGMIKRLKKKKRKNVEGRNT